jgi:hypothetical protein
MNMRENEKRRAYLLIGFPWSIFPLRQFLCFNIHNRIQWYFRSCIYFSVCLNSHNNETQVKMFLVYNEIDYLITHYSTDRRGSDELDRFPEMLWSGYRSAAFQSRQSSIFHIKLNLLCKSRFVISRAMKKMLLQSFVRDHQLQSSSLNKTP